MIKAIFYDFDGVIKESLDAKADAFHALYLPYGQTVAAKVRAHHLAHGGVSRYDKFKIYHQQFLGQELPDEALRQLAQRFSELVIHRVIDAEYVPGAFQAITGLRHHYPQFLLTATPEDEILTIVRALDIASCFVAIYGAPLTKKQMAARILRQYNFKSHEVAFIGDALTDYKVAKHFGLHFIFRKHKSNRGLLEQMDKGTIVVDDLVQLPSILKNLQ